MQPLLQCKSNNYYIFWVYICSYRYRACIAHASYFHLWPARLYNIFLHYFIKGKIFLKKEKEYVMFVLIFSRTLAETFLILRRNKRDMFKNVYWSSSLLFLLDFNGTWIFSADFRKLLKYQISWQPVQWDPNWYMRTDGQTWQSLVAFRNVANAPKMG